MDTTIIVNSVKNHNIHKPILLEKIKELNNNYETRTPTKSISWSNSIEHKSQYVENIRSDWTLLQEIERDYLDYFYEKVITDIMLKIGQQLGFQKFDWSILNAWFQQYDKNGTHAWHNHINTQFTNCYFIELPNKRYKTQILGKDGKIIKYEAKEGDVITFPAWMKHCSPSNSKNRKTVIAFNSNYDYHE